MSAAKPASSATHAVPAASPALRDCASWTRLEEHRQRLEGASLASLVSARAADICRAGALEADLSKHYIDAPTWADLYALADERGLAAWRDALFAGAYVSTSERRAVWHTALRAEAGTVRVDGRDLGAEAARARDAAAKLARGLRNGQRRSASGEAFDTVVHVGIGGSELGPRLVAEALGEGRSSPSDAGLQLRFVSSVDGHALARAVAGLDPARTLIFVASKSFSTSETLANARALREWVSAGLHEACGARPTAAAVGTHIFAATCEPQRAIDFGVPAEQVFELWPEVGGRFSVWSNVNFALRLALGDAVIEALLEGARTMDEHLSTAAWADNLPVRRALLGVFNGHFLGAESRCVCPYDDRLRSLVDYLRQLHMESNGKSVDRDGAGLGDLRTAPIVWGGPGSDAQHAFFQYLHQGTGQRRAPVDFVVVRRAAHDQRSQHRSLLANCIAQSRALMLGDDGGGRSERALGGGHPSTTLWLDELTPHSLGALLAAYEHEVFVQGVIWGINSFDQFGVELGKAMAKDIEATLEAPAESGRSVAGRRQIDPSTQYAIARAREALKSP